MARSWFWFGFLIAWEGFWKVFAWEGFWEGGFDWRGVVVCSICEMEFSARRESCFVISKKIG